MIDINIKCNEGKFKLRTTGIIIKENKILVQKAKKFDGYVLPGGHIELGELSSHAIIREIKEETTLDVKIINLMCITENIYKDQNNEICHEINYYYKLELLDDVKINDYTVVENDKGVIKEQKLFWININKLVENNVKPINVTKIIENNKDIENLILQIDDTK